MQLGVAAPNTADVEKYMRRLVIRGNDDATSSSSSNVVRSIAPSAKPVDNTNSHQKKTATPLRVAVLRQTLSAADLGRASHSREKG